MSGNATDSTTSDGATTGCHVPDITHTRPVAQTLGVQPSQPFQVASPPKSLSLSFGDKELSILDLPHSLPVSFPRTLEVKIIQKLLPQPILLGTEVELSITANSDSKFWSARLGGQCVCVMGDEFATVAWHHNQVAMQKIVSSRKLMNLLDITCIRTNF